jgi:hypothetical protein
MMTQAKYDKMMANALRQCEEILNSKEAARKLMSDLGIDKIMAKYEKQLKRESQSK